MVVLIHALGGFIQFVRVRLTTEGKNTFSHLQNPCKIFDRRNGETPDKSEFLETISFIAL